MSLPERRKLKILSLDGGGIKGLSSLLILARIMGIVGRKMKRPNLQPYQYFDIIGGTSTGGIIALMLGRMRMSVQECISEYQKLGEVVFGKPRGKTHEHMFDATVLERETKKVVKRYLKDENAPLLDPLDDDACKTIVFTLPYKGVTAESPESLRTYVNDNIDAEPKSWTIWEAVRATSAATTIFAPFLHGQPGSEIRYVDAALGFNNPTNLIIEEAKWLWFNNNYLDTQRDIGCVLTIGTGISSVERMDSDNLVQRISAKVQNPLKAVEVIKKIATGTEPVHYNVASRFDRASNVYQRYNVDQGLQSVKLFDYEKREEIEVDTNAYLRRAQEQLSQTVKVMVVLGVRSPGLLEDWQEEKETLSVGQDGDLNNEMLEARFEALRIAETAYDRHRKHWESRTSVRQEGSTEYYQTLHKEIGHVDYLWTAFVQADLLDKRGRCILARRYPRENEPQLRLSVRGAYGVGEESVETTVKQLVLAHKQLREAFRIYRQLVHTAERCLGETSLTYCWAAKRMAAVLEVFGCPSDALTMYCLARTGKMERFSANHWSVEQLDRKIAELSHS